MAESAGHPNVIAGRRASDELPTDLLMDATARSLYVSLWVWNTSTLAWEKMIQPAEGSFWKDKRRDWTSGELDYKGLSQTHKAATDAGDLWSVWKYTWSSGDLVHEEGPITCNWDDRATEDWE